MPDTTSEPFKPPSYLALYDDVFSDLFSQKIALLELGIYKGGSLTYWRDRFPNGTIVGLDIDEVDVPDVSGRLHVHRGSQADRQLLDRIGAQHAPDGFDIIIDDAAHVGRLAAASFWHLFPNHLKPGGIYVIEDWGTGYSSDWSDGRRYRGRLDAPQPDAVDRVVGSLPGTAGRVARAVNKRRRSRLSSHDAGMVGLVKQLVDLVGAPAIEREVPSVASAPRVERVVVTLGQVFIHKPV